MARSLADQERKLAGENCLRGAFDGRPGGALFRRMPRRMEGHQDDLEAVSSDRAVSRLAAACRFRAVDQAYVYDSDILSLAELLLEQADDGAEAN